MGDEKREDWIIEYYDTTYLVRTLLVNDIHRAASEYLQWTLKNDEIISYKLYSLSSMYWFYIWNKYGKKNLFNQIGHHWRVWKKQKFTLNWFPCLKATWSVPVY